MASINTKRAAVYARLSVTTEESVSIERLRTLKTTRAKLRRTDATPVERAVDLGRSYAEVFEQGTVEEQNSAIRSAFSAVRVLRSPGAGGKFKGESDVALVWRRETDPAADALAGQLD